ncbi:MAG TPA: hypothetical protein VH591_20010 [Ktedonobacterales bacterium]|jgi:hypothetical protein
MKVVALSGRRIDAKDSQIPRFPLTHAPMVREQIRALLRDLRAEALVCSASCGADLLALDAANELGIQFEVMLPFSPQEFRATSVVDRPGNEDWDWGSLFDQLVSRARQRDTLHVAEHDQTISNYETYHRVAELVLERALDLSRQLGKGGKAACPGTVTAILVWEGAPRDARDHTAHFADLAKALGLPIRTVYTL